MALRAHIASEIRANASSDGRLAAVRNLRSENQRFLPHSTQSCSTAAGCVCGDSPAGVPRSGLPPDASVLACLPAGRSSANRFHASIASSPPAAAKGQLAPHHSKVPPLNLASEHLSLLHFSPDRARSRLSHTIAQIQPETNTELRIHATIPLDYFFWHCTSS